MRGEDPGQKHLLPHLADTESQSANVCCASHWPVQHSEAVLLFGASSDSKAEGGWEGRRIVTFVIPPHQHFDLFLPSSLLLEPQNQDKECSSPFPAPLPVLTAIFHLYSCLCTQLRPGHHIFLLSLVHGSLASVWTVVYWYLPTHCHGHTWARLCLYKVHAAIGVCVCMSARLWVTAQSDCPHCVPSGGES